MPEPTNVLTDFWKYVVLNQKISGWVAKTALVAPLLDLFLKLGPPWPNQTATSFLAVCIQLLVLMFGFEFWKNYSPPRKRGRPATRPDEAAVSYIRWYFILSVAVFMIGIVAYLTIFSQFIVGAPDHWNREVVGFDLKPQIEEWIKSKIVAPSAQDLLREFKSAEAIWEMWSITVARILAVVVWLWVWGALAASIAAFVAIQTRRAEPTTAPLPTNTAPTA